MSVPYERKDYPSLQVLSVRSVTSTAAVAAFSFD